MKIITRYLISIILIVIGLNVQAVLGAGSSSSSKEATPLPDNIVALVATPGFEEGTVPAETYEQVVDLLKEVTQGVDNNADAFHWLGFGYRQLGQFGKAFDPYNKALAIDKKHLGANEYLGELYLKVDKPKKAKKYLKKLGKYCKKECGEYLELKEKIEAYEQGVSS